MKSRDEKLSQLKAWLNNGYREGFIHHAKGRGFIQGEDLDTIQDNYLDMIFSTPEGRLLQGFRQYAERLENECRRKEEAERAIERERERFQDDYWQNVAREFENLTLAETAPKPQQFRFVQTFYTDPTSPYNADPEFRKKKHGLLITGKSGLGKTAAAWACVGNCADYGVFTSFKFVKSVEFFRLAKLKHMSQEALEAFEKIFRPMLKTPLLILDDLGSERLSEGARETAFELLDTRFERWLETIITTNNSMKQFAKAFGDNGPKIVRRLEQFTQPVNFDL